MSPPPAARTSTSPETVVTVSPAPASATERSPETRLAVSGPPQRPTETSPDAVLTMTEPATSCASMSPLAVAATSDADVLEHHVARRRPDLDGAERSGGAEVGGAGAQRQVTPARAADADAELRAAPDQQDRPPRRVARGSRAARCDRPSRPGSRRSAAASRRCRAARTSSISTRRSSPASIVTSPPGTVTRRATWPGCLERGHERTSPERTGFGRRTMRTPSGPWPGGRRPLQARELDAAEERWVEGHGQCSFL